MIRRLRDTWRKNGPELVAALTRGLPDFVLSAAPSEVVGIPVFCYHDVSAPLFESHLQFLQANGYSTLTADELASALRHDADRQFSSNTTRRVVISFDDGLLSLHDTVFPLLRRYGQRVVAFISPAFHESTEVNASDAGRWHLPTCSWRQIETMHASGLVDFQSHTLEHRLVFRWPRGAPLSGMNDEECERLRGPVLSLTDDFARAREIIAHRLGKTVRHLAFPLYDGTCDAIRIGHNCGYEAFYWGVRPWKATNVPGDDLSSIVRLSGEFLPRLPGRERIGLRAILRDRYARHAPQWWRVIAGGAR